MKRSQQMSKPTLQRHLALFDVHVPKNINFKPILEFIKDYKPTHLIIGGDFLNLEWASHWNETLFKQIGYEKLRRMLKEEVNAGRELLHEINAVLPKDCQKFYIPGNHEEWLFWASTVFPELAGPVDLGVEKMTFRSDLSQIKKQVLSKMLSQ